MKNTLKHTFTLLAAVAFLFACETQTTPEPVRIQHPDIQSPFPRDDAYYARLRAYKKTDHKLAFGWYGSWTGIGASEQSRLTSAPDSMDIISIWSTWHSLSPEQIEDKSFVQQVKGTKVVFCISAKDMPEEFKVDGEITEEGIVAYAKAWGKDSMDKYQYDGMDIDFETAVDHQGPMNTNPANFKKFVEELSRYIGPKSGTGRLFLIDGNVDSSWLPDDIAQSCDYAVSQAYRCPDADDLRDRTASAGLMGWRPEQMIFTENFESLWQAGGVDYIYNGELIPSLLGMAHFAAEETAKGFGSYHMEYEYGHADMPYKYIRQAIQIANPAPQGDYSKNLVTINEAGEDEFSIVTFPSGLCEPVGVTMTAKIASVAAADADISLKVDNSLVASYNDYYYTDYKALEASQVTFSGPLHIAAGTQLTTEPVKVLVNLSDAEDGVYLVPIRPDLPKNSPFSPNTAQEIRYLIITKQGTDTNDVTLEGAGQVVGIRLEELADGGVSGEVSHTLTARFTHMAPADTQLPLLVDPALVEAYNKENGTDYAALTPADVEVSGKMAVAAGSSATQPVTVAMSDLKKLKARKSMIALRVDLSGAGDYRASGENALVKYILITKIRENIEPGATSVPGTPVADMTGWGYTAPGAAGLNGSDMFNGQRAEMGWYSGSSRITATVDMASPRMLAGFRISPIFGRANYATRKLYDIQVSTDGQRWDEQSLRESIDIAAPDADGWQYVKFLVPVSCRYVRMTYSASSDSASGGFCGCNEFNAIAPNN